MPNPKLETYKNKATGTVYDFTDADAQSKVTATVDLLKDTTGWLGGNKWKNDVRTASVLGVTGNVNSNEQIVLTGSFTGETNNVILFGTISLKKGTYKLTGNDGSNDKIALQVYKVGVVNVYDYGDGVEFTLNADTSDILLRIYLNVGATISGSLTISPMLLTSDEYAISPSYRPYHESVDEMLTTCKDIPNVTTASFNNDFVGKYNILGGMLTFTCAGTKIGSSWNAFTINGVNLPFSDALPLGKDNNNIDWFATNSGANLLIQCRTQTDQSTKSVFTASFMVV